MKYAWLTWHPKDYVVSARSLTMSEHGAYCLLLWEYYCGGPIAQSEALTICRARTAEEIDAATHVLRCRFVLENGYYHDAGIDAEIACRGLVLRERPVMARPGIPLAIRLRVFERDGNKCVKCQSSEQLSIDHRKPFSKGGSDSISNLQTMCMPCNLRKGDRDE